MITYDEIRDKSEEFDIHTSDVQRDYVFGWLVACIADDLTLGRDLTLKGGNAFRKAYFPSTRFSDDLDYSTERGYDSDDLLQRFNAVCDTAGHRSGVAFEIDRNVVAVPPMQLDATRQVQKLRLYFRDFTGTTQEMILKVRVDVTEFDRLALPVQARRLIHPYSDWRDCNELIRVVKLEEALADKLRALMQRQHSHDLFDLVYGVFIERSLNVNRIEIVRTFLRKSLFGQDAATPRSLLLALPFELMRRFWDRLVMPHDTRLGFDDALSRFRDGLVELFALFSVAEVRAAGYFPAEHRATILTAGTERTLLRLVYDGVARVVEPYALVFKRPQGQAPREYFYAYDRTGGRSGRPSIKSFFPEKIQSPENLEEPFEPRYPIELTKDGAVYGGSFARPFSSRSPTASRSRRPARPKPYRVTCAFCGKSFPRAKPTTRLNPHKNPYGGNCAGRVGFLS